MWQHIQKMGIDLMMMMMMIFGTFGKKYDHDTVPGKRYHSEV
jgi:hypothetical protein